MQSLVCRPDLEHRCRLLDVHVRRHTDVLQPLCVFDELGRAAQERVVHVEFADVEVQRLAQLERRIELRIGRREGTEDRTAFLRGVSSGPRLSQRIDERSSACHWQIRGANAGSKGGMA